MKSVPLKYIVSVQKGKLPKKLVENSDGNLPVYLSMEVMRGNHENVKYVEDYDACVMASAGDILVLWDGSNAGEVMLAKNGVISSTVALLTLKRDVNRRFIFYQLKTNEQLLRDSSVGMGIPHVNPQELLNFSFFIPSLHYQTGIANNPENGKNDKLIFSGNLK